MEAAAQVALPAAAVVVGVAARAVLAARSTPSRCCSAEDRSAHADRVKLPSPLAQVLSPPAQAERAAALAFPRTRAPAPAA